MIPTEFQVIAVIQEYPNSMVHECANAVAAKLTQREMEWLIASYVLRIPVVIKRTVTDELRMRDSV